MLSEKDIDQAAAQLGEFRTENGRHQTTLSEMLEKYTSLIDDYKRLKSDYEEERDSRERYKQMARGQERNPFVLVLVDGDGYVFDDDLISSGAEGGQRAAHLLNSAVKESLSNRGLENCRIMVRIYANLSGLSKTLSRVRLAGPEKRSLAPFVANFNRSNELFDFVDAGELKENADYKIRAMFRLFAENAACKAIYFAGCHDVGYISELTPYTGNRDRITLVRTTNFHPEFNKLGMRIENLPNIFRQTLLDVNNQPPTKAMPTRAPEMPFRAAETANTSTNDSTPVCGFYLKGQCKYGKNCKFLHIPKQSSNEKSPPRNLAHVREWRRTDTSASSGAPFQMSNLAKNDNDFMSGNRATSDGATQSSAELSEILPQQEDIPAGLIAVNHKQHRLDAYLATSSQEEWAAFNARTSWQKLCNNHHLTGKCPNGAGCQYDHSPVSPTILNCLRQVARSLPCPRRGACRLEDCIQGHICFKADCKHRGGKTFCKIPFSAHTQDLNVVEYVPGIAHQTNGGDEVTEPYRTHDRTASSAFEPDGWDRAPAVDSDDEKENGAPLDVNDTDSVD